MPRPKLEAPRTARAELHHENIAEDSRAVDADASRRQEIVERYGDGLPYDRVRVMDRAKFYLENGARAMLEAGKCLVQIKEMEPHGDFLRIVETLGLTPSTAQHMMAASVKFLSPAVANRDKFLALPQTKLYDLAILDDEEIKELGKGKTVAGLTLDEIDAMSTRELRAKLREARQTLEAKDRVLDGKNRKIDELTSSTLAKPEWQQQFDKAVASVGEAFDKLQLACADAARLAETISELEFQGVERESDVLTLRAQIAVLFHGRSESWLDQGAALILAQREQFVDALLSLAAKKLPEDVKERLFKGFGVGK